MNPASNLKESKTHVKLIKSNTKGGPLVTRTSQACDRCRIKKIKCDGKIPCCTNCLSIGYNCQTSDKLTRRSFPKCYTESLEKNLTTLQNENAKLTHDLELLKKQIMDSSVPCTASTMNDHSDRVRSIPSIESENSISKNFFRYDNVLMDDCYVGLNSFERLFDNVCISQAIVLDKEECTDQSMLELESRSISELLTRIFVNKFPKKPELDLIVAHHFEIANLFLPIVDEGLFFDHYISFFQTIGNNTSNLSSILRRPTETDIDFIIVLILIIELNDPIYKIEEVYELIYNTNFQQSNTITNFQALLLAIQLFQSNSTGSMLYTKFITNLSNLSLSKTIGMGLHLNYNNLSKFTNMALTSHLSTNFNIYSIRLKLYWACYSLNALNNLLFGHSNFKFLTLFDDFHIPEISSLINSTNGTSNLKNFDRFIRLVRHFNDTNILSANVYKNNISILLEFQFKELNIREDNDFIREMETLLFQKAFTQDYYLKLQFQFMVISLKFILDVNDDENAINFLKIFKILNDATKLLGKFSGSTSHFNVFPMNIPRMGLMAIISVLSKRDRNNITTSLKYLVISVLQILKKRHSYVFRNSQPIFDYAKAKTGSSDNDFSSDSVSLSLSNISQCGSTGTTLNTYNLQTTGLFSHLHNYRTYSARRKSRNITAGSSDISHQNSTFFLDTTERTRNNPRQLAKYEEIGHNLQDLLNEDSQKTPSSIWKDDTDHGFSLATELNKVGCSRGVAQL